MIIAIFFVISHYKVAIIFANYQFIIQLYFLELTLDYRTTLRKMAEDRQYIQGLEEYIRQGEPQAQERGRAWQTAIGLQEVDGLKTSPYLLETARRHKEGARWNYTTPQ